LTDAINTVVADHVDRHFVIVNLVAVKLDPTIAKNDEAKILVDRSDGSPREFEAESGLFVALREGFSQQFLEVYAPLSWANPTEKKQSLRRLDTLIRQAVESFFRPSTQEATST
jgi:hypothetical protein